MEKESKHNKEKEVRVMVLYGDKNLVECMKTIIRNHYN